MAKIDRMTWFNEPEKWAVDSDGGMTMEVTGRSDYWRVSHYGFTVDDGPFLYAERGGEFEAVVRVSGDYRSQFDQAGLMLRIDAENWLKAGIEYVDGRQNLSCVVTHGKSDWSVIRMEGSAEWVWIKAVRRVDAVEVFYSLDGAEWVMMRNCWMSDGCPMRVGMVGACPEGDGFEARFAGFEVRHLADRRRMEWSERGK